MGDKTKIEWTEATWNPTTGCDRISPGCDHCYALTLAARLQRMGNPKYTNDGDERTSGPGFALTLHPEALDIPLRWRRPRRIFVNSMSDLFHDLVSDDFIVDVFVRMFEAEWHTFQVLTKRPQRMARLLYSEWFYERLVAVAREQSIASGGQALQSVPWPLPNVWLGVTIELDKYAFRANHLRATPAAVRFISAEPLLGPLPRLNLRGIDWVIAGGESGPGARPMHPAWVRDVRDRCVSAGVPFLHKQWGEWLPVQPEDPRGTHVVELDGDCHARLGESLAAIDARRGQIVARVGKRAAGRELDGRLWDEYPHDRTES